MSAESGADAVKRERQRCAMASLSSLRSQLYKSVRSEFLRQLLERIRLGRADIDLALAHRHLDPQAARPQRAAHREYQLFEQNVTP